ncbi:hypothetical protein [Streptomyces purpurascens]|uniref:ARB-07466-like C-terminal domain-containing protein n=1 Tax=Streptomyces purpurascens TaxID=1924 RepID=A0ABZ1MAJ4_STREF|nr:hypothetical protein [Streptomyces purpurascens]MCE7048318.1 hypothetical protein [Streptomyces purpurascens]
MCHAPGCSLVRSTPDTGSVAELALFLATEFTGPNAARIDDLAAYEPQTGHHPLPQPGVTAFRDLVLDAFPTTGSLGITRPFDAPGRSEHKEGRAWDWRVCRACQGDLAAELLDWLLAPDALGYAHAAARRLGVMYVIWDSRIWGSYAADEGWRPYGGPNPHVDHLHFSFSRQGALARTSWWQPRPAPRLPVHQP